MYTPPSFREDDLDTLHALMRRHGFATLFTTGPHGPLATHLPFVLDAARGRYGTLVAHMVRANPHWQAFDGRTESLVVFLGPHAYISPAWYDSPAAVPTWDYAAVHVRGVPRVLSDAAALRAHLHELMARSEAAANSGWDPAHAEPLIDAQIGAIVGFELPIARIDGKLKFNQNRSLRDRAGVLAAMERSSAPDAREIADIMRAALPEDMEAE